MDNGNIGEELRNGVYVREVVACDHVGINLLVLADVWNFFQRQPGYIIFEEGLCKVICPECFVKGVGYKTHSR